MRGEEEANALHAFGAYTAAHWPVCAAMSRYTATGAPPAGMEPARPLVPSSVMPVREADEGAGLRVAAFRRLALLSGHFDGRRGEAW